MYTIISRKQGTAFKKATKMANVLAGMGVSALNSVAGNVANEVGKAFGINSDKAQLNQQQKLTDMQVKANKDLAEYSYGLNRNMYDYTYDKTKASFKIK